MKNVNNEVVDNEAVDFDDIDFAVNEKGEAVFDDDIDFTTVFEEVQEKVVADDEVPDDFDDLPFPAEENESEESIFGNEEAIFTPAPKKESKNMSFDIKNYKSAVKKAEKGTMRISYLAYCQKVAVSFSNSNPLSNQMYQDKMGEWDSANKRRLFKMDQLVAVQEAICAFEETYGSVEEYFNFIQETIQENPVEKKKSSVDLMALTGNTEQKLEELKEEKVRRAKEKQGDSKVVSLEEQKKTFNEQVEQRIYNLMQERILTDKRTTKLIFFNNKDYCYNVRNVSQQKTLISNEMEIHGLINDNVDAGWTRCLKSFPTYVAKDGREIKLSNHIFSFKLRLESGKIENVYGEVKRNAETSKYYISLIKPERKHNVQYAISSVALDINKVTKLDGSKVSVIDFGKDGEYVYTPNMDRTRDLYKYVLNTCFADEEHHKLVRVYWGSFFVRQMLQKALFNFGGGGDSKSLIVKLFSMLFTGLIEASLNLNSDYNFENSGMEDYPILSQPELKSKDFNEGEFKRFTGGDDVKAHVKNLDAVKFKFEKLLLIMNGNFNDTFVLNDTGNSMVRRIVCAKYNTAKVQIPNLEELLVEGGELDNDEISKDVIDFQGGALEDLLDWSLIGAIELMEMRGFKLEKIGQSVVDFTNEMLNKMITNRDFFKEYTLVEDEYEGVLEDDLYESFLINMRRDGNSYGLRKFRTDIAGEFKRKYGKDIKRGRFNVEVYMSDGRRVQMAKTILGVRLEGVGLKSYRFNSTVKSEDIQGHKNVVVDINNKLKKSNEPLEIEFIENPADLFKNF